MLPIGSETIWFGTGLKQGIERRACRVKADTVRETMTMTMIAPWREMLLGGMSYMYHCVFLERASIDAPLCRELTSDTGLLATFFCTSSFVIPLTRPEFMLVNEDTGRCSCAKSGA